MVRASLSVSVLVGVKAASEFRAVHVSTCAETEEQSFAYDSSTGYISAKLDGADYCLVVDGCGLGQDAPVKLVQCASTNETCASWSLATPPHVDPNMPGAQWIVAPGSTSAAPRCLENPRDAAVDIYCCSGTNNCEDVYPKPISHQQWKLDGGKLKLATGSCLEVAPPPLTEAPVWPLPKEMICTSRHKGPMLSSGVEIQFEGSPTTVAIEAKKRYEKFLRSAGAGDGLVTVVKVAVAGASEELSLTTNYSYSLLREADSQVVMISAASPYGVAYGLESLLQVQEQGCGELSLQDSPVFPHRGLMIDAGRRYYPMPLLQSVLEGMAMYKMNVLHFHVSEECFRIESKVHPGLHTADCTFHGLSNNEFYTQEEIKQIIQFAKMRGIRVVPEFDLPGHSGGFCMGLQSEGMQCCKGNNGQVMHDDENGTSVSLIKEVLDEMLGLFEDDVVHIGADETRSSLPCTLESTTSFEKKIIQHLVSKGKTVMGWEEVLATTGAASDFPDVIIDAWARSSWQEAAKKGHPTVTSENGNLYLDNLGSDHPAARQWLDIYHGEANTTLTSLLLGGEASMWQDQYDAEYGNRPAQCLFQSPERDSDFSNSTSSMIWPRAAIAAGSFWRYSSQIAATDDIFTSVLARTKDSLNKRLADWNVGSCACTTASSTGCKQQDYCGHLWCPAELFEV